MASSPASSPDRDSAPRGGLLRAPAALLFAACSAAVSPACSAGNPEFATDAGSARDTGPRGGNNSTQVLSAPFNPSHVGPEWFARGTGDLVVQKTIDTGGLTIDGQAPPDGITFAESQGLAVLAVRNLSVPFGARVRVQGARPLVVVASATITVAGRLDGSAHTTEPGPGGSSSGDGAGTGHTGAGSPLDSGGSGGGYHDVGGVAGGVTGNFCGQGATPRNGGGAAWGDAMLAQLAGGSGGGGGSIGGKGCPAGTDCLGGAGGGAIQLSAGIAITISGTVNVGGGGGKGGCQNPRQADSGSGGGGGSGGSLLVESLALDVSGGVLAANGGGGGGGSFDTAGGDGNDGDDSSQPAPGGKGGQQKGTFGGSQEITAQRGGSGGTVGPGGSSSDAMNCGNSGGGGGAAGRIYLRSRTPAVISGTVISPPPASGIIP